MRGMHIKDGPRLAVWPARQTFPREGTLGEGEGWRQLSHHMRWQQITPMKGMHRSVQLIQTTLIMCPCGPQIHSHRQEHVLIDLAGTVQRQQSKREYELWRNDCVCVGRDWNRRRAESLQPRKFKTTHTDIHTLSVLSLFKLAQQQNLNKSNFTVCYVHFIIQKPHLGLFSMWKCLTGRGNNVYFTTDFKSLCQSVKYRILIFGDSLFKGLSGF